MYRIPLSVPHMGGTEQQYIREAFATNWLSTVGPNIDAFEREFSNFAGLPAAALDSGTAAVHLGLRLLGVKAGDTVVCPTFTFVASCNPIRYLGAEPILVDSDASTWNIDPNALETCLKAKARQNLLPKAVIVVHLYGQCADMDPILTLCRSYEVPVLEDAAEALGATYRGRSAGTMGDVGVFSFNGNKIITTTGGGMLVSNNPAWVEKARFWAQQAREPGLSYEHGELGYNYRMSNVLAGIGRGQLEVLPARIRQRRAIAFRYRAAFADIPGLSLMPQASYGLHTNWLSCFLADEAQLGCGRESLIHALNEAGIEARPVWKPMHLQPLYSSCERTGGTVTEDLFRTGICLPSSSSLALEQQLEVVNAIRKRIGVPLLDEVPETGDASFEPIVNEPSVGIDRRSSGRLSIATLFERTSLVLDEEQVRAKLHGSVLLVTGAAGSIGAELCRQIARFDPAAIIALDCAETPLFELDREMHSAFPGVPFIPEIANIQRPKRMREIIGQYRPAILFHAAAYKHVSMMEDRVITAVENNLLATYDLARAAEEGGVQDFVLISTDKAVRPTSVMGATKRASERLLRASDSSTTKFVAVRFGNVLGSTGSVIPIFRNQIADGGPVTVTHPDMTRFFMTVQEAGQLVLQAATIGERGQVCVLDMGQPVRILDLAEAMILQAGRTPGQDIAIEFTGVRPGEKVHEEISTVFEDTVECKHEKIRIFASEPTALSEVHDWIRRLRTCCEERDARQLVELLKEIVQDYAPSQYLLDHIARRSDAQHT